jgi:hypothetical protein
MKHEKMKSLKAIPILILLAGTLVSCNQKGPLSKRSTGPTAEILVVTNRQEAWNGPTGNTVREILTSEYPALPQPEPRFDLLDISLETFEKSDLFKTHHSIFIIHISDTVHKPSFGVSRDDWISPQCVIRLLARDDSSAIAMLNQNREAVIELFNQSERERMKGLFSDFPDATLRKTLSKDFGISLSLPVGYYLAKQAPGFIWIRNETAKTGMGLLIYYMDYTDTSLFSPATIIGHRNFMTKQYVPGDAEGSYMITNDTIVLPEFRKVDFNGHYAVETRGLWKVVHDYMGGPFISYTVVDEKRNRLVTLDGYVYAPNAPKRNMIIQIESILRSARFTD